MAAGVVRYGRFAASLTLTHNATSLILPGAANITTAANDCFRAVSLGSGNWLVTSYTLASTGQVPGTATNDSAAAGKVGEYTSSTIAPGSAVSLSTGTTANVTSISLTAGDWDVSAVVRFIPNASSTISRIAASISTTSATLPTDLNEGHAQLRVSFSTGEAQNLTVPTLRISIAATTTVYLVANSAFAVSTMAASGQLRARRVR